MKVYRKRWAERNPEKCRESARRQLTRRREIRRQRREAAMAARPKNYGTVKICANCNEEKSLEEFNRHAMGKFGRRSFCRICENAHRKTKDQTKIREQCRAWAKRNHIKILKWTRDHQRVRRGAKCLEPSLTDYEWQKLLDATGRICLCCGIAESESIYRFTPEGPARGRLTPDHIKPVASGGSDNISNIQPLCLLCNMRKSNKTIDYRPQETYATTLRRPR